MELHPMSQEAAQAASTHGFTETMRQLFKAHAPPDMAGDIQTEAAFLDAAAMIAQHRHRVEWMDWPVAFNGLVERILDEPEEERGEALKTMMADYFDNSTAITRRVLSVWNGRG